MCVFIHIESSSSCIPAAYSSKPETQNSKLETQNYRRPAVRAPCRV